MDFGKKKLEVGKHAMRHDYLVLPTLGHSPGAGKYR